MARNTAHVSGLKNYKRNALLLVLFLLLLYVAVPHLGEFSTSLSSIRHADGGWVLVCLFALLLSYAVAAFTYVLLAKHRLRYLPTVLIEAASMFTNRLLPAGAGAIGINYAYLRRSRHQAAEAAGVVATNNLLGFAGHVLLFLGVLVAFGGHVLAFSVPDGHQIAIGAGIALLMIVGAYVIVRLKRGVIATFLRRTFAMIIAYHKHPKRLAAALASSIILTATYVLSLYAASRGVGIHLPVVDVFIVLTFGVAGATILPTPGGLGGAEASIVGGFMLYGVSDGKALAAALLYRLFTYWLAFALGAVGFAAAEKKQYI